MIMATVTIKYSKLEDTCRYAKKLSENLGGYADEIYRKIISPISGLPGNDNRGYASTVSSSAGKKIRELQDNASRFNTFSQDVERFVATAKCADSTVAKSIKCTANSYIGERSAWDGFWDFLWNTVCVDFFNATTVGRFIKDCTVTAWSSIASVTEKVRDWFKHGDGKYWWNIVSSIVAPICAIAGTITAVAAAIAGGPVIAVVLAVVAAAAAILGAVITTVNSAVKFYNNVKALSSDDPGVSRYLGTINGYSDAIKKYDMGDAEDNKNWETSGKVVDTTKTVCDVIGIVKGITDLGAVKSDITGRVTGYKFDKNNVMYNIRKRMGFDFDKNKFTSKGELGFTKSNWNVTKSWYANENGYGGFKWLMNRYTRTQKTINSVFNIANVVDKAQTTLAKADSIYDRLKTGFDFSSPESTLQSMQSAGYTIIETYEALGNIKLMKGINSVTVSQFRGLEKVDKRVKDWTGKTICEHLAELIVA